MHFSAASRILADLATPEPRALLDPSDPDNPATPSIPGYRILSLLGAGGGGHVYKAVRDGSDHPVAIKILHTRLSNKAAADRAWRELDLLESLRLPALPRLLDYGLANGRLYFATEFIDGLPIDEYCAECHGSSGSAASRAPHNVDIGAPALTLAPLQRNEVVRGSARTGEGRVDSAIAEPLPLPARTSPLSPALRGEGRGEGRVSLSSIISLLSRLASAVQSLHEHGIIHRDLKPSNILIDRSGNPVIIDLGIAALLESASGGPLATLTEAGAPIGTPAFMSPEQARGERSRISTRSDVYSLGAIATLLLTGRTPHDIGPAPIQNPQSKIQNSSVSLHEAIRRAAHDDPIDPRTLDPTLPKPLAAVLSKACHPNPQHRYPTAAALAQDLTRWLKGEPVTAAPMSPWRKATRWAGRHPILTTAAACAAILAGTVAGILIADWQLQQRPFRMKTDQSPRPRWAELVTMTNRVLRSWDSSDKADGALKFADLVTAPDGRRLPITLLLFDGDSDESGRLCVWDPIDPFRLLWNTAITPEEGLLLPPPPPGQDEEWDKIGRAVRASAAIVADVFADAQHPGKELIVSSVHYEDPSNISVYDLAGNLLYRAWHWGSIGPSVWLNDPGLIVLSACDNTAKWIDLGIDVPNVKSDWPNVVMAIKPVLGVGVTEPAAWLNTPSATPGLGLEWYRYVAPAAVYGPFDIWIQAAAHAPDRDALFRLDMSLMSDDADSDRIATVTIYVDGQGRRVRTTLNDHYNNLAGTGDPGGPPLPMNPNDLIWLSESPNGPPAEGWD